MCSQAVLAPDTSPAIAPGPFARPYRRQNSSELPFDSLLTTESFASTDTLHEEGGAAVDGGGDASRAGGSRLKSAMSSVSDATDATAAAAAALRRARRRSVLFCTTLDRTLPSRLSAGPSARFSTDMWSLVRTADDINTLAAQGTTEPVAPRPPRAARAVPAVYRSKSSSALLNSLQQAQLMAAYESSRGQDLLEAYWDDREPRGSGI